MKLESLVSSARILGPGVSHMGHKSQLSYSVRNLLHGLRTRLVWGLYTNIIVKYLNENSTVSQTFFVSFSNTVKYFRVVAHVIVFCGDR